jgi:TonB-dependent SusC/RagA subfamily outer membrane receptor
MSNNLLKHFGTATLHKIALTAFICGCSISMSAQGKMSNITKPLHIVDSTVFEGDVNQISPSNIESLTILKGETAIARYGSQAAGGVIIITTVNKSKTSTVSGNSTPLYIVDGTPFEGDVNQISPSNIESLTILKGETAATFCASQTAGGVIVITTKNGKSKTSTVSGNSTPLYIVDDMPFDGDVNQISPSNIESLTIMKGETATARYGSQAAGGVIIITTKNPSCKL